MKRAYSVCLLTAILATAILATAILATSCTQNLPVGAIFEPPAPAEPSGPEVKKWTFILYMACDNDLESAAIQDFNELEAAQTADSDINLLVLIDRSPAYDSTNGNWTDTRLYEISPDTGGPNNVIVSERIACPPLGITADGETELDMSDPAVLEYFATFTAAAYPAENLALIFWGHGTGWRSTTVYDTKAASSSRALAIDDTSSGFMGMADANKALAGRGLSVIGFDTCFGALLEIAFEFRDSAQWLAGSEGIIPSSGWNYTDLLTRFKATDFSPESFGTALVLHFADQYALSPGATMSFIDLSAAETLRTDFELFSRTLADSIVSGTGLDAVRELVLDGKDLVHALSYPCDAFIDIQTLTQKIAEGTATITADPVRRTLITEAANNVQESLSLAVRSSWSADGGSSKPLAVHLVPLAAATVPMTPHCSAYTKGSGDPAQSEFVRASTGWVPTASNEGTLLDKIFYTVF